jgi:hypothetical protein
MLTLRGRAGSAKAAGAKQLTGRGVAALAPVELGFDR